MSTRLSVNINDETAEALKELAERRGTTVTEIVRRMAAVYKFVDDESIEGNKTFQMVDPATKEKTTIQLV